jgi:very-short-patch-repair endonuclease
MGHIEHTPWSRVGEIAREQWSQITSAQLRQAGLSLKAIRAAADRGNLFAVHTGVFSVGHPIASPYERAMAAVLACGPGALLSHGWALWNYDLARLPDHPPDVTAPLSRHDRGGITVHRSRYLAPDHNHGIPTTTPDRTIIDVAPTLPSVQLRRIVNQAQISRLTTADSLRRAAQQAKGVPTKTLLAHLPEDQHGATRSLLEDLVIDLHRERDLPLPEVNRIIDGRERDFSYPALGLILEADGFETHSTRQAFEDDRDDRLGLEANGKRVLAVSYRMVTRDRDRTMDRIDRILSERARAARRRP